MTRETVTIGRGKEDLGWGEVEAEVGAGPPPRPSGQMTDLKAWREF